MKILVNIVGSLILLTIITSCTSSKTHNNIDVMDFDSFKRWGSSDLLTQEESRSGKWSTYVDSMHEYSLTYERALVELLEKGYKKATFYAWVLDKNNAKEVKAVLTIDSPTGINYAWQGANISSSNEIDGKGWKRISVSIDLIKEVPEAKFKAYFWSPKREKVIIDDIELEFN
jgi:hypothetical protein